MINIIINTKKSKIHKMAQKKVLEHQRIMGSCLSYLTNKSYKHQIEIYPKGWFSDKMWEWSVELTAKTTAHEVCHSIINEELYQRNLKKYMENGSEYILEKMEL